MKPLTLITSLLFVFVIASMSVSAYPFLTTGHDAEWNDTAEIGASPYAYGWDDQYNTGGGFVYTSANAYEGIKSIGVDATQTIYMRYPYPCDPSSGGCGLTNSSNYVIEAMIYDNTTIFTSGIMQFSITESFSGGYGTRFHIQGNQPNYYYVRGDIDADTPQDSGVARSDGWHRILFNITENSPYPYVKILIDGVEVANFTNYYIGAAMHLIDVDAIAGAFFVDNIHVWNATVGAPPPPPSVVNYTVVLRANNTNTSTIINSFSTTFNSIGKSTTNGTTIYGQISNGTYASSSITASGYVSQSGVSIPVAGDTTYTFQMVETPPAPPSPPPASPENHAITIIIALFAIVALLGAGIYEHLNPSMQSVVYKYAAWIVGIIAAIAVIIILASM